MKLSYKIIWFEDDQSEFEHMSEEISNFLISKAFIPEIIHEVSDENLTKRIEERGVNLIIIDYNLARGGKGDKLIKAIRGYDILTEILFYSVDYPGAKDTDLNDYLKGVDGIFYCRRIDVEEKAKKVIDLTLRKIEDLNNMRGLVMAEVADLENLKNEIIIKYNSMYCDKKEEILSKTIKELSDRHTEGLDRLKKMNSFEELMNELDLSKKSQTVYRIKRIYAAQLDFNHETFNVEIIKKRDLLAHVKEEKDEFGKEILKSNLNGKELIFSDTEAKLIRKDILKYKDLLEKIKSNLEKIK